MRDRTRAATGGRGRTVSARQAQLAALAIAVVTLVALGLFLEGEDRSDAVLLLAPADRPGGQARESGELPARDAGEPRPLLQPHAIHHDPGAEQSAAEVTTLVRMSVVDPGGRGIPNASIDPATLCSDREDLPSLTDMEGGWHRTITHVGELCEWGFTVSAEGFADTQVRVPYLPTGLLDLGEVALRPTPRLAGIVRDARGAPVPEAVVTAVYEKRGITGSVTRRATSPVSTDHAGRFELTLGPIDQNFALRVVAWHALYGGPAEAEYERPQDAVTSGVELRLALGAVLSGVVLDSRGEPLDGAAVALSAGPYTQLASVMTRYDGRFELRVTAGRPVDVVVSKQGYLPEPDTLSSATAPDEELVLRMAETSTLEIHVSDSLTGEGIPDFDVSLCVQRRGHATCHDATGTDGQARLNGLLGGAWQPLSVAADGYQPWESELGFIDDGQHVGPIDIALVPRESAARLAGRVVGDSGEPVGHARVELWESLGRGSARSVASTQTTSDGEFSLERVPEGTVYLGATGTDGSRADPVELQVGDRPVGSVVLTLLPGAQIDGRVIDGSGNPIPRALLLLEPAVAPRGSLIGLTPRRTASEATGEFRFEGVAHGRYRLIVRGPPVQGLREVIAPILGLNLRSGEVRPLVVVMAPRQTVTGRISGPPLLLNGATVIASPTQDLSQGVDWTTAIAGGYRGEISDGATFVLTDVPAGHYEVRVLTASGETLEVGTYEALPNLSGENDWHLRVEGQLDG